MNDETKKKLREEIIRNTGIANIAPQNQSFWNICDRYHRLTPDKTFQNNLSEMARSLAVKSNELLLGASVTGGATTELSPEQAQAARFDEGIRKVRDAAKIKANIPADYTHVIDAGEMLMRLENDFDLLINPVTDPPTRQTTRNSIPPTLAQLGESSGKITASYLIVQLEEIRKIIKSYRDWIVSLSEKNLKWWNVSFVKGAYKTMAAQLETKAELFENALDSAKRVNINADVAAFRAILAELVRTISDEHAAISYLAQAREKFGGPRRGAMPELRKMTPSDESKVSSKKSLELHFLEMATNEAIDIAVLMEKLNARIKAVAFEY